MGEIITLTCHCTEFVFEAYMTHMDHWKARSASENLKQNIKSSLDACCQTTKIKSWNINNNVKRTRLEKDIRARTTNGNEMMVITTGCS